jgi:hypothetical protein
VEAQKSTERKTHSSKASKVLAGVPAVITRKASRRVVFEEEEESDDE